MYIYLYICIHGLYSHIINMHIYTYTCRIHIYAMNKDDKAMKTSDTVLKKIYLSLYLKGCVWEEVGDWTKTATYWSPQPLRTSLCVILVLLGCSTRGLGAQPLWHIFSFQHLLTNWSGLPNSLTSCLHRVI